MNECSDFSHLLWMVAHWGFLPLTCWDVGVMNTGYLPGRGEKPSIETVRDNLARSLSRWKKATQLLHTWNFCRCWDVCGSVQAESTIRRDLGLIYWTRNMNVPVHVSCFFPCEICDIQRVSVLCWWLSHIYCIQKGSIQCDLSQFNEAGVLSRWFLTLATLIMSFHSVNSLVF